jgi:hypothetical protein
MPEQQQQIAIDGHAHALMNVMVNFDEENFQMLMMSGGPARLYVVSPQHAKRVKLLLERQLEQYEKKYSKKIDASLPTAATQATTDEEVGFKVKEEKKK